MSYTRKNLNVITLLLTIFIFVCLCLIIFQISLLSISAYYPDSSTVYSEIIPIQEQNIIEQGIEPTKQLEEKTQRQVIENNKVNVWRIQIPKLGLDAHIEEGTNPSVLLKAVGHFEETSSWDGNVCLAGHNRGYLCNFFQKIKKLNIGDEIIYCSKQGKRVYQVQTNKVILETDWSYIEETEDNRITLITCEENCPEYRRCVQAVQVLEYLK